MEVVESRVGVGVTTFSIEGMARVSKTRVTLKNLSVCRIFPAYN